MKSKVANSQAPNYQIFKVDVVIRPMVFILGWQVAKAQRDSLCKLSTLHEVKKEHIFFLLLLIPNISPSSLLSNAQI